MGVCLLIVLLNCLLFRTDRTVCGGGGGITAHLTIMRIIYTQFTIYNQICSPGPAAAAH